MPVHGQLHSRVVVWGDNSYGQTNLPPSLTNIVAVASGSAHNLAVGASGTVSGWGNNSVGQATVPAGLSGVVAVTAGFLHSLALKSDGTLVAWGYGGYGLNTVPAGFTNGVAIDAGAYHNLVVTADGRVIGWGNNGSGQLNIPVGLSNVTAVAGGLSHSLALMANGTVSMWGNNSFGQLNVPAGLSNVVAIGAGNYHNVALLANGTVVAWGYDNYGQIDVPHGLSNIVAIACGDYHSLALKTDGTVVGWGNNANGQARASTNLANVAAITAGSGDTVALVGSIPVITAQPQTMSVTEASSAAITVGAVGVPKVVYQWQLDGTNLPGCTQASLMITNVRLSDAGSYSARVSNSFGSVMSAPAILTVNPSIIARCSTVVVAADANCVASASIDNGSSDPAGGSVVLAQSPPGPYPVGTNVVTLTVSGTRGGSASCSALVVVLDRTPPQIVPPATVFANNDLNQCGAVVTFQQPAAGDACSTVTSVTCTPPSGSFFPVGTTLVQCSAQDAAGNVAVTNFSVTVLDRTPPRVVPPPNVIANNDLNQCGAVVTFQQPSASDTCSTVTNITCTPPSGSFFAVGTTVVQCSAQDAAGNVAVTNFSITVLDRTPPHVVPPPNVWATNALDQCGAVVT
ncbi:MAG: hypothetical protein C5B50_06195, partial [Verrucomicrobia bacterium]